MTLQEKFDKLLDVVKKLTEIILQHNKISSVMLDKIDFLERRVKELEDASA